MLLRVARQFATAGRRGSLGGRRSPASKGSALVKTGPPPPAGEIWQPVKDKATGLTYYWNTQTDETTALGAPKPSGGALGPPQQQGSSLLGMVAEGMAFGTGAHLAGRAVSSLFGGGGSSGGGDSSSASADSGDQGGGDDSWDV